MRLVLAAILGCACSPRQLAAEFGHMEGVVRDVSQAVMPGTLVSSIQEETGFQFVATVDRNGEFHLTVPGGHYNIFVRRVGFRTVSRLDVAITAGRVCKLDFELRPDSIFESVLVSDSVAPKKQTDSGGDFVAIPDALDALPRSDRTVTGLLREVPGLLQTPANAGESGQVSSLGARPNSNSYLVDGLRSNNAVSGGGWPSFLPVASLPAMSALGTTHNLAVFDAIEQVAVDPLGTGAGTSHTAGATILVRTKSGTDQFHGSAFGVWRPSALYANDWFANRNGVGGSGNGLTESGVSAGGPLVRGRTFFFAAAETLRLRQDFSWIATVPSIAARLLAPVALQSVLLQFPVPNGPAYGSGVGLAELRGSKSYPAKLDSLSLRLDHALQPQTKLFLRAAVTPSWNELGYAQISLSRYRNTVAAFGLTRESARWTHQSRIGFSRAVAESRLLTNPTGTDFYSQFPSLAADFASLSVGGAASISVGQSGRNRQDVLEVSHTASLRLERHELQVGADYQELHPLREGPLYGVNYAFSTYTDPVYGPSAPVSVTLSVVDFRTVWLHQASGFLRDTWRLSPSLTVTFGIRTNWLGVPRVHAGPNIYSVPEVGVPTPIAAGTPIWSGRIARDPSVSMAWRPVLAGNTVFRASWTAIHDNGSQLAATLLNPVPDWAYRTVQGPEAFNAPLRLVKLGYGFSSRLRLPAASRWSASLERAWAAGGTVQVSYSGMAAASLLRMEMVDNPSALPAQLSFATSHGTAVYHGLNAAYRRPLTSGLQGQVSYSWSHTIDVGSSDSSLFLVGPGITARNDRGDSGFDARQTLAAALSYSVPALMPFGRLFKGWTLGTFFYSRTAFPVEVLSSDSLAGFAVANLRPNLAPVRSLWIPNAQAAGGRQLNPEAFAPAYALPGNLGRNAIRGFGMWQADCSLGRSFAVHEHLRLAFRADAYNVFNHPRFADPVASLSNPRFGQSESSLNLMMGSGSPASGQSPAFQMGGPRSLQFFIRLSY